MWVWLHRKTASCKSEGISVHLLNPTLFHFTQHLLLLLLVAFRFQCQCDVVPQARCPRWCPCSRTLGTACRLCRTVWPNLSVKNFTDSWTTVWMRKLWHRWVLKPARPAPKPRTPCCTIDPCRSASVRAHHAKRLPVSECTGPCASHRVRLLNLCHYLHMHVSECVGVWMCMNASLGMCDHEWKSCVLRYI